MLNLETDRLLIPGIISNKIKHLLLSIIYHLRSGWRCSKRNFHGKGGPRGEGLRFWGQKSLPTTPANELLSLLGALQGPVLIGLFCSQKKPEQAVGSVASS